MNLTINQAMSLSKAVRSRLGELISIRNANAVEKKSWDVYSDGREKERTETTAKYDPKVVDVKVTELEIFLFKVDASIKQANAITKIDIEADVDKLLEPIR